MFIRENEPHHFTPTATSARSEVNELVIDHPAGFDASLRLVAPDLFARLLVQAVERLVLAAEKHVFVGGHGRAENPSARLKGPKLLSIARVNGDDAGLVEH